MKVYLCQDIPKVGMAGEIINVSEGYANNFLFPKKLAVEITEKNELFFQKRVKTIENRKEVIAQETSMLAEKIKSVEVTIKRKMHDNLKLYGAIAAQEVVDSLNLKGIKVSKSQIIFDKSIKEKGSHQVTIKLSSRLQPQMTVTVVSE